MSRIQNILDKAERDGGVRRMRTLVETAPPPTRVLDVASMAAPAPTVTPLAAPSIADVGLAGAPISAPAIASVAAPAFVPAAPPPAAVPAAPGTRIVRSTGLDPALIAVLAPGAPAAEQYRALRTRLATSDRGTASDVILVTSPGRGEGKTVTATNLALTIAQDCQTRVCIVDADLRHSRVHALLGVADAPGLADLLTGEATLADTLVTIEGQQITVLPAGKPPAHPAEFLGSTAMRRTLQTLRTQFDRVIVDAPSALPLADVGILAPIVDSVVLVVQAGVTTKPAIQDAVSSIGPDRVLGVVLNGTAAA
jgi:capsular exopolysaccharide synthesis family protein